MTAEGFKINSQGGSERHTQEGKGSNQNMLHIKKFLDKKLRKIK